tara:strand:+ start:56 stop:340 length:285 start_codon:yes stop_codon:yes gene_type:complete
VEEVVLPSEIHQRQIQLKMVKTEVQVVEVTDKMVVLAELQLKDVKQEIQEHMDMDSLVVMVRDPLDQVVVAVVLVLLDKMVNQVLVELVELVKT